MRFLNIYWDTTFKVEDIIEQLPFHATGITCSLSHFIRVITRYFGNYIIEGDGKTRLF